MEKPDKILVIQLRRIGDVILTLPALKALRKAYPSAQIDFLVEKPSDEIARYSTDISNLIVYDKKRHYRTIWKLRKKRYDWVIDYLGNPRSIAIAALSGAKITAGINDVFYSFLYTMKLYRKEASGYISAEKITLLEPLGVKFNAAEVIPEIKLEEKTLENAKEVFKKLGLEGHSPVIALAPASRRPTRLYPKEHYAALAKMLVTKLKAKIIVCWGPGEEDLAKYIAENVGEGAVLSPQTRTLTELAGILQKCDLVIANANGPNHIATAVGTKTLTVLGSCDHNVWVPHNDKNHLYVRNEQLPCVPCRNSKVCMRGDIACLQNIKPETVFAKAEEMLKAG